MPDSLGRSCGSTLRPCARGSLLPRSMPKQQRRSDKQRDEEPIQGQDLSRPAPRGVQPEDQRDHGDQRLSEHRRGRRAARIRRRQEGEGQEAPFARADTQGLVLKAKVHAASVMDWEGIKALLRQADTEFPRLSHLWVDSAYRGEGKGKDRVEKALGWSVELVERPRKPAPKEALKLWAEQQAKEGVTVNLEKLLPPSGLQVLPRR